MVTGSDTPTSVDSVYYPYKDRKLVMKIMREMIKCHTSNPNELSRQLSTTNNSCSHKRINNTIQRLVSLGLVEKYAVFKTKLECSCKSPRFVIEANTYDENLYSFLHLLKCRKCRQRYNFSNNDIDKQNQNDYALSEDGLLYILVQVDREDQIKVIQDNTEFEFFNLLNILMHSKQKISAKMMFDQLKEDIRSTLYLKSKSVDLKNQFDKIIQTLNVDSNDSELLEYKQKILSLNHSILPLNLFTL